VGHTCLLGADTEDTCSLSGENALQLFEVAHGHECALNADSEELGGVRREPSSAVDVVPALSMNATVLLTLKDSVVANSLGF
jgi:hypothetical protein